jgi:C1A family cysteine protease
VDVLGPRALRDVVNGVYSLAQWQSGFKLQNDRGTCWAFAGAAALEAAYRRKYNMLIDVSEEYIFHMGKAFALGGAGSVENNSSLTGFQGSGDIAQKISENAIPPEDTAPYLQSQQELLDILPVLGFAGVGALASQEDYDAVEFCEQHIPLLARVNARYRATGWGSLGTNPSITALENTILADREVICDVSHKPSNGGHVLLLIGFDRNRQVFLAKNHWGAAPGQVVRADGFIEIAYTKKQQCIRVFRLDGIVLLH